ncbi:MAG: phosphoadenylyl-sulfate reductase [Thermomonas sp.]|uniref:phosphoadenylyl-sulfate reductase n=1 Tax=Thermomonas sp. TaxID=1971895 RepID=UPI001EB12611|nr:phosphoadenylyl-sulfate reductase [Thermomonas sp.]MBV2208051.1 phosphoadenylyl-sulfate reductase [Thermomonas sp.]
MSLLDPSTTSLEQLLDYNRQLATLSAQERVAWAFEHIPGNHALSTSFGIQSAVSLHLATQVRADIPVILIDTGYLFPETYRYADQLTEQLHLNLKVYRPDIGSAWMEARFGKLWENGGEGIARYNQLSKVEPMQRALEQLNVRCWHAGLRRNQASTRKNIAFLTLKDGRFKFHPIADWNEIDIGAYMLLHDLPEHPLAQKGYVSVGDVHTTRPLQPGMDIAQTRFFGLRRECGLHFSEASLPAA